MRSNGCGPAPLHVTTPAGWGFDAVCDAHDRCFGTCGSSMAACNDALCDGLPQACGRLSDPQDLFPCLATASGFCSAVKADARGFFEDSQREYCACELPEQPSSRSVTESFALFA